MQEQPSLERRFLLLENRVAELERAKQAQEDRDIALLARIDNFTDDLRRIERVQMRSFDELKVGQKELTTRLDSVETRLDSVESNVVLLVDAARDHRKAIESLATGQQQIIEILSGGKPKTYD